MTRRLTAEVRARCGVRIAHPIKNQKSKIKNRNDPARLEVDRPAPELMRARLLGDWRARRGLPGMELLERAAGEDARRLEIDTLSMGEWNSGLLVWLVECERWCGRKGIEFDQGKLTEGPRRLLELATSQADPAESVEHARPFNGLERLGLLTLSRAKGSWAGVVFLGECLLAFGRLLRGRAQFRWSDAMLVIQQTGPEALGIVALINLLVGMIMAFVGSVQLIRFGAAIYVADSVAIAMVREMGAMMTAIIMTGRTGAAFAAQLGTMKVNEEIDSFQTFGISPVEFLILPRLIALALMMPLLCVFADLIGILGGLLVSMTMLDVTLTEYFLRTREAVDLTNFLLGVGKSAVFGVLVGLCGCWRGIQSGRTAADVGAAATSAVVTGITAVIVVDAVFALLCNALGI